MFILYKIPCLKIEFEESKDPCIVIYRRVFKGAYNNSYYIYKDENGLCLYNLSVGEPIHIIQNPKESYLSEIFGYTVSNIHEDYTYILHFIPRNIYVSLGEITYINSMNGDIWHSSKNVYKFKDVKFGNNGAIVVFENTQNKSILEVNNPDYKKYKFDELGYVPFFQDLN